MRTRSILQKTAFLLLLTLGLMAGCGRGDGYALNEEDEPSFRRGESLLRENRQDEALLAFENVVDHRRDCPESHLELGRIYMDHVKDPLSAIYHFRKYLELQPDSDTAKQVSELIETAKKDFARSLPGDPFGESIDRVDLLEQLRKLRAENEQLRKNAATLQNQLQRVSAQLAAARHTPVPVIVQQPVNTASPTSTTPAAAPSRPANVPPTYTVQPGDSLSKISQAVYGTSSRWRAIYEANQDQLKNPHDLKVGMVLKVP